MSTERTQSVDPPCDVAGELEIMPESASSICPRCGEELAPDWDQCPFCEASLAAEPALCPGCQQPTKPKWRICPKCKRSLQGWATPTGMGDTPAAGEQTVFGSTEFFSKGVWPFASGDSSAPLPISNGDSLLDFEMLGFLGAGQSGSVYLARNHFTGEDVAIKIILLRPDPSAQALTNQIIGEFKLLQSITDKRHVIQAYDPRPAVFKNLSLVILPMEHADGGNLDAWLKEHPDIEGREDEALRLIREICLGVRAMHEAEIAHLDIKNSNILISQGRVKIGDLGISRYIALQSDGEGTERLQGAGTPHFMSPEQFSSPHEKMIGMPSDIYSLGCVLYGFFSGSLPFSGTREELKEKHLHVLPSPLKGAMARWWPIVSRCLMKDPDERYQSVVDLIADIDRVQRGGVLLVDVSCPKCNHINVDTGKQTCEKCDVPLGDMFRICHRCSKKIRKDVDICSGCDAQVGAFYLFQERWTAIQRLKDEDPSQAIDILETVLREGTQDKERDATDLIRELRDKQNKIADPITQANEAFSNGDYSQAKSLWNEVTKHFPRHTTALERIGEINSILDEFRKTKARAKKAIDAARFDKGIHLLERCIELIPNQADVAALLDDAKDRSERYAKAMVVSSESLRNKDLDRSQAAIGDALLCAPQSPEALLVNEELMTLYKQVNNEVKQAKVELDRANFPGVGERLQAAEHLHAGRHDVVSMWKTLEKTKSSYERSLSAIRDRLDAKDLSAASKNAAAALALCPRSSEARQLKADADRGKSRAKMCVQSANEACRAAEFDRAKELCKEAKSIWPKARGLKALPESIASTQSIYDKAMQAAQCLHGRRDLVPAEQACLRALSCCPDSVSASGLQLSILDGKRSVERHLRDVVTMTIRADFGEAGRQLACAKDVCPTWAEIPAAAARLKWDKDHYSRLVRAAKWALLFRRYDKAEFIGKLVAHLFPESEIARKLSHGSHKERCIHPSRSLNRTLRRIKVERCIWWLGIGNAGKIVFFFSRAVPLLLATDFLCGSVLALLRHGRIIRRG